jgi:hypothetical protein
MAPQAGLEPATYRLTAGRSTIELLRIVSKRHQLLYWIEITFASGFLFSFWLSLFWLSPLDWRRGDDI